MAAGRDVKNLHLSAKMPTPARDIDVYIEILPFEYEDGERSCELQIRKSAENGKLWAHLDASQARVLARRLKQVSSWIADSDMTNEEQQT